jgi:SAM-dependent MidA family methyltransferase
MALCLYDAGHGYYASPATRPIGRDGDFHTSVSVGAGFGFFLALAIEQRWREDFDGATPFLIVEQGAHDGQLALDIVSGLREHGGRWGESRAFRYLIHEPDSSRRLELETRLREVSPGGEITVVATVPTTPASAGLFLCNELLDAFPVHRVRWESGAWRERRVGAGEGETFRWISADIAPGGPLAAELEGIVPADFPDGYTTELCLGYDAWMAAASRWFHPRGIWWVIDYGFEAADFFAPERREGTLRCYRDHRVTDDPFHAVGAADLTSDVNFTRLDRAAAASGLARREFTDQHHFLTRAAAPWLHGIEAGGPPELERNRRRLRQFQTLTHPGMMGRSFKVAEYIKPA